MAYQVFHLPKQTGVSSNMTLLSGARAYFYLTGTSTPLDTYQDSERTTPHTNPVVADSAGVLPAIYLDPNKAYRFTLKTASDVELYTVDPANDMPGPSGTYTPVLTNGENVGSTTAKSCQWMRSGNAVMVSGSFIVDPVADATKTVVGVALPFSSDFTATGDCAGTCGGDVAGYHGGVVVAGVSTNIAGVTFQSASASAYDVYFAFMYVIK